jgi:hypothetical protein
MKPKLLGCCTKCDAEVFDVAARDEARIPIRLGAPHEDAMRANFLLLSGSRMDLTFCKHCIDGVTADDYRHIWSRVVEAWHNSTPGHDWTHTQKDNMILALLHVKPWKEVL